ncbi:MAG: hypothetical protein K1X47_15505 [Cyclobacteriaceae bacterium]|nr:hypothetical protein [Cyclobacteriaceae bacterium]
MIDFSTLLNISRIIEKDSKSTTYKLALLRSVIDIIQENSPYIEESIDRVHFPMGLVIEKWLLYYYPILESSHRIPQIHGSANLAFATEFQKLISHYKSQNGFSKFYRDLIEHGIAPEAQQHFQELAIKIYQTIKGMPMRYIGSSLYDQHYSIFRIENRRRSNSSISSLESLISSFGSFSIPVNYFEAFKLMGNYITGQESILMKWAEFSVGASDQRLTTEMALGEMLKNPITSRDILTSKKLYEQVLEKSGRVFCVWTGKQINSYEIDHVIPFSIWRNNDLWNLLPAQPSINRLKRDKIPSPETIEKSKDRILNYWELLSAQCSDRFPREIKHALLGNNPSDSWRESAIERLKLTTTYLIDVRGYEGWRLPG